MKGNKLRVYIAPMLSIGVFGAYIECTDDVDMTSLGTIDQNLDNTDYNIGIYRTANISLTFRNDSGKYSDIGQPNSIFTFRRGGSLVKITWQEEQDGFICGFFVAGDTVCGPEIEMFRGILNDDSLVLNLDVRTEDFALLGLESILSTVPVNFSALVTGGQPSTTISIASPGVITATAHGRSVGDPIQFATTGVLPTGIVAGTTYYVQQVIDADNFTISSSFGGAAINTTNTQSGTQSYVSLSGQMISDLIKTMLNQAAITAVLTYDAANINVGLDQALDSINDLQNQDVLTAMQDLLLLSNSVFYVSAGAIIVAPRTVSPDVAMTFFGQSSINGPENIQNIQNIKNGMNQLFNYFYWTPSNATVKNDTSIAKYGAISKSFNETYFTSVIKQQNILNSLLNEFGLPKQYLELYTQLTYETLGLLLLNKVTLDFPPMYLPGNFPLPICGTAICGDGILPNAVWSFFEIPSNPYKIIGSSIDPSTWLITFILRRV